MNNNDIAIKVSNLSKCYQIYNQPNDRLKQFIVPKLCSIFPPLRKLFPTHNSPVSVAVAALAEGTARPTPCGYTTSQGLPTYYKEFWALKDVSFEIKKGETVGIIGRNGSGKSTLLQMICGTLNPTSGSIQTHGRIAALLELGSGFNPEFTGRENVYMNAAVLGLSKEETDARFDEIIAFADIGDFIEQSVKTYSSGMMVRLAFSVAVHVDPQILIVDEALSVGDLAFQNKCMAHIRKMSESGTTILFVTHDLSTTQLICDRVVWLQSGQVASIGDPVQLCRNYYIASLGKALDSGQRQNIIGQQDTKLATFTDFKVVSSTLGEAPRFEVGERVQIHFELAALSNLEPMVFGLSVYRSDGDWLIGQTSQDAKVTWPAAIAGELVKGDVVLEPIGLAPGEYSIALAAYSQDMMICYGMTSVLPGFIVYADYPTWGKVIHPISWHALPNIKQLN